MSTEQVATSAPLTPPEVHHEIEKAWISRARALGLNPGTKKYIDAQGHYFCGAMQALHNARGWVPSPKWSIGIMRGDDITRERTA